MPFLGGTVNQHDLSVALRAFVVIHQPLEIESDVTAPLEVVDHRVTEGAERLQVADELIAADPRIRQVVDLNVVFAAA